MRVSWWLAVFLILMMGGIAAKATDGKTLRENGMDISTTANGSTILFRNADFAFATGYQIPETVGVRLPLIKIWPPPTAANGGIETEDRQHVVWAHLRFDRSRIGAQPLAIQTSESRERLVIYVNGVELYRNFSSESERALGASFPLLIGVSHKLLRPGLNSITIRAERSGPSDVGIGYVYLGPRADLARQQRWQNYWRILFPTATNFALLFVSIPVLFLWVARPSEQANLFLGLSGILWFLRNYQFAAEAIPFNFWMFRIISDISGFFAVSMSLSFCVTMMAMNDSQKIVKILLGASAVLGVAYTALLGVPQVQFVIIGIGVAFMGGVAWMVFKSWREKPEPGHWALLLVVAAFVLATVHDMARLPDVRLWAGMGFLLSPFIGVLLFFLFLVFAGRRLVASLASVEGANIVLEQNIAAVKAELVASEEARRAAEIERAIGNERERLMREMHDGIGSNLVSALAVAEQQRHPPATIATLKRAITDLKLTVDSLEPVEGDLVALIANLRHRMEPQLRKAGLVSKWTAEDCPPLTWLDATNALHVLRILQEAISNALIHSHATQLEIGCGSQRRDGREGLLAFVADDGHGFVFEDHPSGSKGIANMQARARSLHGWLDVASQTAKGTRVELWLPIEREAHS